MYNNFRCHSSDGAVYGGVAQLGERLNGIQEVMGSIPTVSTKTKRPVYVLVFLFWRPAVAGLSPRFARLRSETPPAAIN